MNYALTILKLTTVIDEKQSMVGLMYVTNILIYIWKYQNVIFEFFNKYVVRI